MSIYTLKNQISDLAFKYISSEMEEVNPAALGLDPRSCHLMWASHEGVAIKASDRSRFDYYAGGEYVNKEAVHVLGDYVIYENDGERVEGWIAHLEGRDQPEEEEADWDDWNNPGSRHHY